MKSLNGSAKLGASKRGVEVTGLDIDGFGVYSSVTPPFEFVPVGITILGMVFSTSPQVKGTNTDIEISIQLEATPTPHFVYLDFEFPLEFFLLVAVDKTDGISGSWGSIRPKKNILRIYNQQAGGFGLVTKDKISLRILNVEIW